MNGFYFEVTQVSTVGQRSCLQRDHMRSDEHFERHSLTCLRNSWTYFNETRHSYSVRRPHNTSDIFKVTESKVKVGHQRPWKSGELDSSWTTCLTLT